jgi:hypothetical protein
MTNSIVVSPSTVWSDALGWVSWVSLSKFLGHEPLAFMHAYLSRLQFDWLLVDPHFSPGPGPIAQTKCLDNKMFDLSMRKFKFDYLFEMLASITWWYWIWIFVGLAIVGDLNYRKMNISSLCVANRTVALIQLFSTLGENMQNIFKLWKSDFVLRNRDKKNMIFLNFDDAWKTCFS